MTDEANSFIFNVYMGITIKFTVTPQSAPSSQRLQKLATCESVVLLLL